MTVHRRPLGRARVLAIVASVVLVIGCLLPWWTVGGRDQLPETTGNAFAGSGIVLFIVAMAIIALVSLPYAAGDRPVMVDRWLSFLALAIAGWLGLVVRVADLALQGAFVYREPADLISRSPGLAIVVVGMIVLSEAVLEMARDAAR
jgi:hypothetical protein